VQACAGFYLLQNGLGRHLLELPTLPERAENKEKPRILWESAVNLNQEIGAHGRT
jgi:hypothetical protein